MQEKCAKYQVSEKFFVVLNKKKIYASALSLIKLDYRNISFEN